MGKFEIIGEEESLIARNVAIGLEVHEGVGIAFVESAANKFGDHIGRDSEACDGLDDTAWDHAQDGHEYTINDDDG